MECYWLSMRQLTKFGITWQGCTPNPTLLNNISWSQAFEQIDYEVRVEGVLQFYDSCLGSVISNRVYWALGTCRVMFIIIKRIRSCSIIALCDGFGGYFDVFYIIIHFNSLCGDWTLSWAWGDIVEVICFPSPLKPPSKSQNRKYFNIGSNDFFSFWKHKDHGEPQRPHFLSNIRQ